MVDKHKYIQQEATKVFYTLIKNMLCSIDRREEYISRYSPAKDVNYSSIFSMLPEDIEVNDLEEMLEVYEEKYGEILCTY